MHVNGATPQVATDVWRITTPMPHRPREVHAYLVRGDGNWFLLDGGIDSRSAWDALDAGVRTVTGGWRSVSLQVISHMHMDHLGLVRRALTASGADLAMGALDADRAAHAAAEPAEEANYRDALLRRCGGDEQLASLAGDPGAAGTFPGVGHPLAGRRGPLPGFAGWEYVWTPGHTAGHISLFRASDRVLLAGDCVLPGVTPTIGVNRQRLDPVADQLRSLQRLEDLAPTLSCGGHGEPVEDPRARIAELREETLAESARVLALVGDVPSSTRDVVEVRYAGRELPPGPRMLAFRETLAHLEHLVAIGAAVRSSVEGVDRFRRTGVSRQR